MRRRSTPESHRLLHQLVIGGHGAVGVLALLIGFYNLRRGRRLLALAYAGVSVWEVRCVAAHAEEAGA